MAVQLFASALVIIYIQGSLERSWCDTKVERERNNKEEKNSGMEGLEKKVMFVDSKKEEGSMNHKNEDSFYKQAKSKANFQKYKNNVCCFKPLNLW